MFQGRRVEDGGAGKQGTDEGAEKQGRRAEAMAARNGSEEGMVRRRGQRHRLVSAQGVLPLVGVELVPPIQPQIPRRLCRRAPQLLGRPSRKDPSKANPSQAHPSFPYTESQDSELRESESQESGMSNCPTRT
jgi:hypothetical protein